MEYAYTSADYYAFLLAVLGGVLLLPWAGGILGIVWAARRGKSRMLFLLVSCTGIVGFVLLGFWAVPFLLRGYSAI